ncbi:enoyl-CoA hydratase/isomerase family protein [Aestuariimicrobium sp. T2.26MG-19.2B]|uniref:enoyl-CoA hydratase/isomerase family protein n=1 Tax=Aestuariimicrobium sp. T2.26MG-19.2B TaxID=3040679 RepID=UPI0024775667|nr:enoyl-CoA hydratase-related protein [Aestuariimicrobium sp. T2.26MG-19.2B]CAI9410283.1 Short-chain-enoyl-CoA hydratase [Aestuariimicrobium sp. T2.26MG-19.2B]
MNRADVVVERVGRVAVIRLDRPPVNALSMAMQDRLGEIAHDLSADAGVRAVVVTGNGKNFAAGVDIKEMSQLGVTQMSSRVKVMQECFTAVAKIGKPVVAAVNGYALGGGCELALCADRRIAGESTTLGQPEILLGIMPGAGGTQRLPRLIGSSAAKDLIFTGRRVHAQEALALGLVDEVVPDAELVDRAVAWAAQFENSPSWAISWAKESIDTGLETDLDNGLTIEATGFASLFGTEDRRIGMKSFLESGPGKAVFRGR